MDTLYVATETEQAVLEFARRQLGANLASLLLAGLGEPSVPNHRRFDVQTRGASGPPTVYQLEVISEDGRGVPAGRHPMVLAGILHMLFIDRTSRDEVVFSDKALLTKLGWEDTVEARRTIAAAIKRYYTTAYYLGRTEVRGAEQVKVRYSRVQKLVSGYDTTSQYAGDPPVEAYKSTVIYFGMSFFEEVSGEEKYFLGIDFESLRWL
jgi:hypothetical protein